MVLAISDHPDTKPRRKERTQGLGLACPEYVLVKGNYQ